MDDTRPLRAFDVRVNESNGSLLLVRGMDAFELGDVEAVIWQHCDGTKTVDDIATTLVDEFAVEREVALRDVKAFVSELRSVDLLE
jgi:hypothetical protein